MAHAVAGRHCTVHKHHPSMGQGAQVTALSLEPPSERTKPPPKSNLDPDRKSYPASSDEEVLLLHRTTSMYSNGVGGAPLRLGTTRSCTSNIGLPLVARSPGRQPPVLRRF